ncbi:MAG: XRE family transcriptional regulator [Deltaproteobacteria bacterium]|nr:MAG: XRE family transcriptional regulator [Deltaproteobacteria bacterium]
MRRRHADPIQRVGEWSATLTRGSKVDASVEPDVRFESWTRTRCASCARGGVLIDGQRVRSFRIARALTQEDVAEAVGIARNTVVHAERGGPVSLLTLRLIACWMDCAPEELLVQATAHPHGRGGDRWPRTS